MSPFYMDYFKKPDIKLISTFEVLSILSILRVAPFIDKENVNYFFCKNLNYLI